MIVYIKKNMSIRSIKILFINTQDIISITPKSDDKRMPMKDLFNAFLGRLNK
jgi:hypothetical protein